MCVPRPRPRPSPRPNRRPNRHQQHQLYLENTFLNNYSCGSSESKRQ